MPLDVHRVELQGAGVGGNGFEDDEAFLVGLDVRLYAASFALPCDFRRCGDGQLAGSAGSLLDGAERGVAHDPARVDATDDVGHSALYCFV